MLAQRAVDLSRESGDAAMRADALRLQADAELKTGHLSEAMTILKEARDLSERVGALATLQVILGQMYFVYELLGEFAQAAQHITLLMENADRIGDPVLQGTALFIRGCLAIEVGAWEQAQADLERSVEMRRHGEDDH